LPDENLGIGG
jgi:50S ribosomal subunit-associated GTPase HflX